MKLSNAMFAGASTTAAELPAWAWAQAPSDAERYGYGPHMMWWGGGWYGMIFGPLIMILVLAVVIAVAVLLVRWRAMARYRIASGAAKSHAARHPQGAIRPRRDRQGGVRGASPSAP